MKRTKTYEIASFKALPDLNGETGRFEAIVSVFGNVDLQGDRVKAGAFTKSLDAWKQSGDPIPIIWSHDWADPFAHIGAADPNLAEELPQGLKLVGSLDVDKPFAAQVYDLLKSKRVREWSFAYDIIDEKRAADKANDLITLDLIEAGPTLKGANPDTVTLGVKSALAAAAAEGEKHASASSYVQSAHDALKKAGAKCATGEASGEGEEGAKALKFYGDAEPVEGSYEDTQEDIEEALQEVEGANVGVCIVATFDDHVVYNVVPRTRDGYIDYSAEPESYSRTYTYDEATDEVTFGDRTPVEVVTTVTESTEGKSRSKLEVADGSKAAFDDSAWDGPAAMSAAGNSDDPAASFRSIAFERNNDSADDTAAHWALPHHKAAGDPPNVKGVAGAIGALNGGRGGKPDLKNEGAARTHLENHQSAIQNAQAASEEAASSKGRLEINEINTKLDVMLADI